MEMARGKNKTNENETIRNIHINKSACFIIHPPLDRNEKKVWTFPDRLTHGQLMEEIKFHPLASRFIFIRSQSYLNYFFKRILYLSSPLQDGDYRDSTATGSSRCSIRGRGRLICVNGESRFDLTFFGKFFFLSCI